MITTSMPRSYDSTDCSIMVQDLPEGKYLLSLHAGAVAMRMTLPCEVLAFLFDLPVAHSAAGVVPLASASEAA